MGRRKTITLRGVGDAELLKIQFVPNKDETSGYIRFEDARDGSYLGSPSDRQLRALEQYLLRCLRRKERKGKCS